ncbi:MAG: hypothetical protein KGH56_00650 [Patescibacteria group bacterium]|nr:hypothetical protein [Patescibacteria group bacterium]
MHAKQWRQGLLIGFLVLVAFWLVSLIWGLSGKAQIAVSQAHEAQAQYQALEDRKAALQATLDSLGTERGQEAAIRTAFGVARPGEEVIVVVPPTTTAPTTSPSWWQEVLNWF